MKLVGMRVSAHTEPTINTPALVERIIPALAEALGPSQVMPAKPVMGAEDFSFMLQARPGCFFFIGSQSDERTAVPHHNARFAIDEACLPAGVRMMVALALDAPIHAP